MTATTATTVTRFTWFSTENLMYNCVKIELDHAFTAQDIDCFYDFFTDFYKELVVQHQSVPHVLNSINYVIYIRNEKSLIVCCMQHQHPLVLTILRLTSLPYVLMLTGSVNIYLGMFILKFQNKPKLLESATLSPMISVMAWYHFDYPITVLLLKCTEPFSDILNSVNDVDILVTTENNMAANFDAIYRANFECNYTESMLDDSYVFEEYQTLANSGEPLEKAEADAQSEFLKILAKFERPNLTEFEIETENQLQTILDIQSQFQNEIEHLTHALKQHSLSKGTNTNIVDSFINDNQPQVEIAPISENATSENQSNIILYNGNSNAIETNQCSDSPVITIVDRQCTETIKGTNKRCRKWAMKHSTVCYSHRKK